MTLLRSRISVVMALLMVATLLSWWLSRNETLAAAKFGAVPVLLIAACKIRFIMLDFIEIRAAPRILRVLCEAWVFGLTCLLIAFTVFTRSAST